MKCKPSPAGWPARLAVRFEGSRLEFKIALAMSLLVSVGLVVLGGADLLAARQQALRQVSLTQQAQARELASAVRFRIEAIQRQLDAVTAMPWEVEGWLTAQDRRHEFQRLLKIVPAIDSVHLIDREGNESLTVSRREADRLRAAPLQVRRADTQAEEGALPPSAQLYYAEAFDPTMRLTLRGEPADRSIVLLDLNLRMLSVDIGAALSQPGHAIYAADADGQVLLHRDPGVLVRRTSIADAPHFLKVDAVLDASESLGIDGREVLVSAADIGVLGLRAYVEQPREEALRPVRDAVARTTAVTLLWLVPVVGLGIWLARRITRPVKALTLGAAALARGELDTRIEVQSPDELGQLAHRFNAMASALQDTIRHQEQRIAEKTAALEAANRHKSEFVTIMSHELRTPLHSLHGFAELLANDRLTPDQHSYVFWIQKAEKNLLKLVNEMLDLSKIEAGRMELHLMAGNVGAELRRAIELIKPLAAEKQVLLSTSELSLGDVEWVLDGARFGQVALNLLANAVKFTPEGGRVSASLTLHEVGLRLEVTDTGVGIAAADLPHMFETFRQFGDSAKSKQGTGLGLALVKRLVELHGGTVGVESEPGLGSRFFATFPRQAHERDSADSR